MNSNIKTLSDAELHEEINYLEDSFAEALADEASPDVMRTIWKRILELKKELQFRQNFS